MALNMTTSRMLDVLQTLFLLLRISFIVQMLETQELLLLRTEKCKN